MKNYSLYIYIRLKIKPNSVRIRTTPHKGNILRFPSATFIYRFKCISMSDADEP